MAEILDFPNKNEKVHTGYSYFAKGILDKLCEQEKDSKDFQLLINTPEGIYTLESGRLFSEEKLILLNVGQMVMPVELLPHGGNF